MPTKIRTSETRSGRSLMISPLLRRLPGRQGDHAVEHVQPEPQQRERHAEDEVASDAAPIARRALRRSPAATIDAYEKTSGWMPARTATLHRSVRGTAEHSGDGTARRRLVRGHRSSVTNSMRAGIITRITASCLKRRRYSSAISPTAGRGAHRADGGSRCTIVSSLAAAPASLRAPHRESLREARLHDLDDERVELLLRHRPAAGNRESAEEALGEDRRLDARRHRRTGGERECEDGSSDAHDGVKTL